MFFMISGSLLLMTAAGVMDMNALLDRFHNYILPYVRGEERICGCKCGRHNVYHVIPYDGDESSRVDSKSVAESVTKQEIDLTLGLLMGFCLTWCLLWLDGAVNSVLRARRAKQHNDADSWWVLTLCNIKELCRWGHWRQTGESTGNMTHNKQTLIHNGHHKPRHLY